MKRRAPLITLTLLMGLSARAEAEAFLDDDLSDALYQAGRNLVQGKDRKKILDQLNRALEENPNSRYLQRAKTLSADLAISLKKTASTPKIAGMPPLMETTMPRFLATHGDNCGMPFDKFMAKPDRDPMVMLLRMDRNIIESLLPMLSDTAPTRSSSIFYTAEARIPRVCDMAILAIQFHSKCRFHFNASSGELFHELKGEDRNKIIRHIKQWWKKNKTKSVAQGIRSHLPHADFYATVWMAENLAGLGGDTGKEDRKYALEVLRSLVQKKWGHTGAYAARALAKLGDFTPVEIFCAQLRKTHGIGRLDNSSIVFYVTDYGTRREWELLHKLAQAEISRGPATGGYQPGIWPALVTCKKAKSSPLAIPGLALALTQPGIHKSFTGTALERFQKLTENDFGYHRKASAEEETAAVRKALKWWNTAGSKKYTFDNIEAMMKKKTNKSINQDKQ